MTFNKEPQKRGITIKVSAFRKSSGMKGCGRAGATGKQAVVTVAGQQPVTVKGSSFRDLCRQLRSWLHISPSVKINENGVTEI